jgi:hypothetical protein
MRAWIASDRRQARELAAEADLLERLLPALLCECGGDVMVPHDRRTGRPVVEAMYALHTLGCPRA